MPAFAPGVEADEKALLVARERTMSEWSDKLWARVEYMGTESVHGTVNAGAAWKFAPNVAVLAGYDHLNDADLAGKATMQVDIDF